MRVKKGFLGLTTLGCIIGITAVATSREAATSSKDAILERGPHHRVVQNVSLHTNAVGQVALRTNTYTELATGLHYFEAGEWKESREEIELLPGEGAVAAKGPHKVIFPPDIYDGLIEVFTPDGKHLKSRPLGIGYYDGTNSVLIAELTNSVGLLLPTGNQVIYTNCFTDFGADIRYTYRKNGFEQDIILRQRPPEPQFYGLNPRTARLEVITEFFETDDPVEKPGELKVSAADGLADRTLSFGKLKMVRGKAFSLEDTSPMRARGETVYKSWERLEGRKFLVETVPLAGVTNQLKRLPWSASVNAPTNSSQRDFRRLAGVRQ